jgi:hypothetical protein
MYGHFTIITSKIDVYNTELEISANYVCKKSFITWAPEFLTPELEGVFRQRLEVADGRHGLGGHAQTVLEGHVTVAVSCFTRNDDYFYLIFTTCGLRTLKLPLMRPSSKFEFETPNLVQ